MFADRLGGLDVGGQPGSAGAGGPPVDEFAGLGGVEVAVEDFPEGFFQCVGAPDVAAAAFEFAQGGGFVAGEVAGILE